LFENGKQVPVQVKRVPLSEIYPKIRFICDLKENVIAERACVGARLRTTRKNNWLSVNKKVNPDRTLYVYQLVQGIQNREHAKKNARLLLCSKTKEIKKLLNHYLLDVYCLLEKTSKIAFLTYIGRR
jgi:hypothetical protein